MKNLSSKFYGNCVLATVISCFSCGVATGVVSDVDTSTINSNTINSNTIESDCIVQPHMSINLGSPVSGVIKTLAIRRGDTLKKGQLVAQLDSDLQQASYDLAKLRYSFLQQQYERSLSLVKQSLASQENLDLAITEMNVAEMEMKQRHIQLQQRFIKSPVDGVVVNRIMSPGEYVYEQTPIISLIQADPLNVEIFMPMKHYGKLREGQEAKVILEDPVGGEYKAKIEIIDKMVDAASSTYGVRLHLPNPDLNLPSGLKCIARFRITAPDGEVAQTEQ